MHLKKKGRSLLGYTPIGFVASSAKKAMMNDFVDNILLTEVVWEAEIVDSQTGERYGAMIISLGNKATKKEFTSWDQLMQVLEIGSARLMCRLDNSRSNSASVMEANMRSRFTPALFTTTCKSPNDSRACLTALRLSS